MLQQVCPTCADCPLFESYHQDTRGRGLCKLFDQVARSHHEMTQDCQNNLITQLDEIELFLYSHEVIIDPEYGFPEPARVEVLSIFLPHSSVSFETIWQEWQKYADQFSEFYFANWYWANNPASEF